MQTDTRVRNSIALRKYTIPLGPVRWFSTANEGEHLPHTSICGWAGHLFRSISDDIIIVFRQFVVMYKSAFRAVFTAIAGKIIKSARWRIVLT